MPTSYCVYTVDASSHNGESKRELIKIFTLTLKWKVYAKVKDLSNKYYQWFEYQEDHHY